MPKRKSDSITFRGGAANAFMAGAAVSLCKSNADARKLLENSTKGPYRFALIAALERAGFSTEPEVTEPFVLTCKACGAQSGCNVDCPACLEAAHV